MAEKITYRTARKAHTCERCVEYRRGRRTIAPGHRYLLHTAFPGHDVLTLDHPVSVRECIACATAREDAADVFAGACGSFCCGDTPCALPVRHDGDHSCRRDITDRGPVVAEVNGGGRG